MKEFIIINNTQNIGRTQALPALPASLALLSQASPYPGTLLTTEAWWGPWREELGKECNERAGKEDKSDRRPAHIAKLLWAEADFHIQACLKYSFSIKYPFSSSTISPARNVVSVFSKQHHVDVL